MQAERFDVIVVGAGYGGVTAAAVLADAGMRVLLLDKNRRAGGKAMTLERAGARCEMWPIAGGPAGPSRFHELARLIGLDACKRLLQPERACCFMYIAPDGVKRSFVVSALPVKNPLAMFRVFGQLGVGPTQLGGLAAFGLATALLPTSAAALDRMPAIDLLRKFRLPGPVFATMAALLNLLFVVPLDRLPASEAVRTLRDLGRGGAGRYHAGGYGSVAEHAASFVEARGGTFLPRSRVERIEVEGGRVRGVVTKTGAYRADVVVSNAGIQPTVLKLVGAERWPTDYVEQVRRLEPSWAFVGVRYELDAPVFQVPMTVAYSDESWWDEPRFAAAKAGDWPEMPLLFVTVPTLYDPSLAPADRQLALIGTIGSPDPGAAMNAEAIARAERMTLALWPEIERHLVWRDVFSARHVSALSRDAVLPGQGGECIGLGQLIGQCGRDKPSARSPIAGLYFVGCDAGGYGCGTHQAVDSGFAVARMVRGDRALGNEAS